MKLCFTPSAWNDYLWVQEHDRKLLKRVDLLVIALTLPRHRGEGQGR